MNIKVYSLPHCNQCKTFCNFLDNKNIAYNICEDTNKIVELGEKYNILSAPVVEIDNKYYNSKNAMNLINK